MVDGVREKHMMHRGWGDLSQQPEDKQFNAKPQAATRRAAGLILGMFPRILKATDEVRRNHNDRVKQQ